MSAVLKRVQVKATVHGFRSSFRDGVWGLHKLPEGSGRAVPSV